MLVIDGSFGEGGGQILRSALALSLITGQPFRIDKIRAGRKNPGLLRQHLTAVNAAAQIGQAELQGATIGSQQLTFTPGAVTPGNYHFAVGTAGSATLVFQTVLPALLIADAPSTLTLEGGTHNPFAPPYDFLVKTFLPLINRTGAQVKADLIRPGFYPAGGGQFTVTIKPAKKLTGFALNDRGEILARRARAIVASLPESIGERELKVIANKLSWDRTGLEIELVTNSRGPGNVVVIEIETENLSEVFTGFGERGVRAEEVANQAVKAARHYLLSSAPVGEYLADQLLIPLALAGAGEFVTVGLSLHTTTNITVLQKFLPIEITTQAIAKESWQVVVRKR